MKEHVKNYFSSTMNAQVWRTFFNNWFNIQYNSLPITNETYIDNQKGNIYY